MKALTHPIIKQFALAAAISAAVITVFSCSAHARPKHHRVHRVDANGNYLDPRPARWCGWWLRHQLGVADRAFNLAANWRHYGSAANGPAPGVVAVYWHHVGLVTAVPGPGRIILKSGNDGHAVRERERSTRGIIAYRWPGQNFAGAE